MKAKQRLNWASLHTWFACFFLPFMLLYLSTGILYLFDIEGGVKQEYQYPLDLPSGWPNDEQNAKNLILPLIEQHNHGPLPPDFYYKKHQYLSWYGYKQEITLYPGDTPSQGVLKVLKHDTWHQLLLIHKGHAGPFFWFFGVMLGLCLLFSLISGMVLAVTVPRFKTAAIACTLAGTIALVMMFVLGY